MQDGRSAIENILYTYGELIDAGDFKGIGKLFEHATMTADGMPLDNTGAAAIEKQYQSTTRIYPDTGTPKTKHVITNLIIDVDEDAGTGTCRACYTVFQATETLPLQPIIAGRYHQTYERLDGTWCLRHHKFFVDLAGDLSHHLLIDL